MRQIKMWLKWTLWARLLYVWYGVLVHMIPKELEVARMALKRFRNDLYVHLVSWRRRPKPGTDGQSWPYVGNKDPTIEELKIHSDAIIRLGDTQDLRDGKYPKRVR